MNVSIRAYRILTRLAAYKAVDHSQELIPVDTTAEIGKLIGTYQNPAPHAETVYICNGGIAWGQNDHWRTVRFSELSSVSLPNAKTSHELRLNLHDGTQLMLPVRGQNKKFFDSLAMITFLDRVIQDTKSPKLGLPK
jgi:hypothetical protein